MDDDGEFEFHAFNLKTGILACKRELAKPITFVYLRKPVSFFSVPISTCRVFLSQQQEVVLSTLMMPFYIVRTDVMNFPQIRPISTDMNPKEHERCYLVI